MREKLVCYLLGELDDAERIVLESRLANEPCLRKELEQIRACLFGDAEAQEEAVDEGCPEGLADRTAHRVAKAAAYYDGVDAPCRRSQFTFVDMCVAAGVLLAVGAMLLPALPQSRAQSRRVLCEKNMSELGQALNRYAGNHRGYYPHIGPSDNAGMFAVRLVESGELSKPELQRLLLCRASGLQEQLEKSNTKLVVVAPTPEQLREATGQLLAKFRRWMAGSYAYRLGYIKSNAYHDVPFADSSRSPMLSDAPDYRGGWVSVNHGLRNGQNVLYQDGHVEFRVQCDCPEVDPHMFVNNDGQAAAGQGISDIVLVRSDLTPGIPRHVRVAPMPPRQPTAK